jgi:Ca-activated chloride channel homolog
MGICAVPGLKPRIGCQTSRNRLVQQSHTFNRSEQEFDRSRAVRGYILPDDCVGAFFDLAEIKGGSTVVHPFVRGATFFTFFVFLAGTLSAQSIPIGGIGPPGGTAPFDTSMLNSMMLNRQAESDLSPQTPSSSVSKLDLKAPGRARREYAKGFQLMNRKEFQAAIESLLQATTIYPDFVAAHNALGSSYLGLGQNQEARDEFAKAVALDDHLPTSHLNLGCAEFALKNYPAAEADVKKASDIAPLDLHFLTALAYAQLLNHNFNATVATTNQVHDRKHSESAIVHYYAAAAWDNLNDLEKEKIELQTLIKEDPKSSAAEQARGMLKQLEEEKLHPRSAAPAGLTATMTLTQTKATVPTELPSQVRKLMQDIKEQKQVTEAEAMCESCETTPSAGAGEAVNPGGTSKTDEPTGNAMTRNTTGWTLHSTVDEVSVFFAATDHGRAISDLTQPEVGISDNHRPPETILGFRSEAQLPLRMGIVIDTSDSITERFSFEQKTASNFLQKVVSGKDDQAFVVGFSNSVLLVQDLTGDKSLLTTGVNKLAAAGGTALWDAVSFAADKLANIHEAQPVAKVLVVISDGEDNSSSATLKEAIEKAAHGEVIVYAVSTRDNRDIATSLTMIHDQAPVGDRALKSLSEHTGGAAYFPGSVSYLNRSLDDLQQIIRSRYLVSYKPALFKRDGEYRTIEITAQKSGHKLHVYSRKGYYSPNAAGAGGF